MYLYRVTAEITRRSIQGTMRETRWEEADSEGTAIAIAAIGWHSKGEVEVEDIRHVSAVLETN